MLSPITAVIPQLPPYYRSHHSDAALYLTALVVYCIRQLFLSCMYIR